MATEARRPGRRGATVTAMVVVLALAGAGGFAVSHWGWPWWTAQPRTPAASGTSRGTEQLITVTGGHFDPVAAENIQGTLAFPKGKVPRIAAVPRSCSELRRSLRAQGGYDSTLSLVRITINARRPVEIRIQGLRPRLLAKRKTTHVVPVYCVPAHLRESTLPEEVFIVLDDEPWPAGYRQAWLQRTPTSGGEFRLARDGSITLRPGQVAEIEIVATQGEVEVDWELVVDLLVNGNREEIPVRDGNEPFHYTPNSDEPGFLWCEARPNLGLFSDDHPEACD